MKNKEEQNQKRVPVSSPFREFIAVALFLVAIAGVFLMAKCMVFGISLSMK
ncbi:hypothetical protein ACKTG8_003868 [Cronobacter sakazakii]|uniref:hypothetical protein n=1 Tax=Cronobacter TaxID=413496 RepID=UPI001319D7B6|nr:MULTISPECIES: hypothetical protein [Cronobacter]EJG0600186.1 hypothetical protein [Cronobacter sakazakii]EJG0631030.1 hypothetical protein [Cronobacter sakazakii]EJQ2090423.1 hypothetical protein [Cronobacter sakazakii]EJR9312968.1 hypothetical protein [Cronobacter sakazakii]EJR9317560.1 hypothetical protein [Cronobacter sakazakii]